MADDFNDWIDGEPITDPSSDGSFTEWIDGEPVIRYEDSATLLVIPDAAHLHDAENLDVSTTVWSQTTTTLYSGVYSYRNIIPAASVGDPSMAAVRVRVLFDAPGSYGYGIAGASIGLRSGSTEDYTTDTAVRITFNDGDPGIAVPNSPDVWSDWVEFPSFSHTDDLLLHFDQYLTSIANWVYGNASGSCYRKSGELSDALVDDISGYTTAQGARGIKEIQVALSDRLVLTVAEAAHLHEADNLTVATDAATDLVIPDAYHLHDADQADAFIGIVVWSGTHADAGTATMRSYRGAMVDTDISDPGITVTKIRVRYADTTVFTYGITGASIGLRDGTTSDYQTDKFTRLTFNGGSNTVTVGAGGGDKWSDWVDIDWFDDDTYTFVHTDLADVGGTFGIAYSSSGFTYRKDGTYSDAMVADISGYTLTGAFKYGYNRVEVAGVPSTDVNLVIPDAAHLHDADVLALTQVHDLVVAACDNLHEADNIDLVELIDLTVAEAYNELVDEGPITIQTGLTLGVAESYHDLVDEGPLALIQEHALVVAECDHLHDADSIVLTALHILTVAECYHVHAPPNLTLTTLTALTVQESAHLHEADNITLGYQPTLAGLDAYHLHEADNVVLACAVATIWLPTGGVYNFGGVYRNFRQIYSSSKAWPQHNQIRFLCKGPASPADYDMSLTDGSVGYRSGTTDTYTAAPTALTWNGGSTSVDVARDGEEWTDWIDFEASATFMVHFWLGEGFRCAAWNDDKFIYDTFNSSTSDSFVLNPTSGSAYDSRIIAEIQTRSAVQALVVEDTYHLNVADPCDITDTFLRQLDTYHALVSDTVELSLTAWVNEEPWTYDTSVAARNYRMIMPAAILDYEGQYVRAKIECHDTDSVSMDGMSIGRRKAAADAFDYDDSTVTPVRFTFDGGSNDVVVGAGESKWSDWVPFALDPGQDHLIHCHLDGPHKFAYNTVLDCYRKNASTDETMLADVKSYTLVDEFFYLVKLEVRVRSVMSGFDDAVHLHTADNLALGVHLTVDDAFHLHEADAIPALTGTHNLTLAACDHLHDADALTLTQDHALALDDADHLHEADTLNLAGTNVLVVSESDHLHTADAADLIVTLAVDESDHLHTAPNLTIVSGFDLEIPETVILTVSDNIAGMTVSMTVASSYHDHLADTLAITATHYLTVAEAHHLHTADSINTYMTGDLPIQSAHHEIESDELTLGFSLTLTVQEAYHRHFVDTLALTQEHTLAMPDGDSYHDHFADNIEILALPEGLERTFIDSLTADRTFWTRTTDLEILTPTRPIDDTVLTSYLGVTTKHELASLTQARTILRI